MVKNDFIHKDTENCMDILFGNILKEPNYFPDFNPLKPPPQQFWLQKKCKSVWGKLKKHHFIEKTQDINNLLT